MRLVVGFGRRSDVLPTRHAPKPTRRRRLIGGRGRRAPGAARAIRGEERRVGGLARANGPPDRADLDACTNLKPRLTIVHGLADWVGSTFGVLNEV
jgi:hypothetical protein